MSLYTRFTAHLDAVLDALEADGVLPAGLNRKPVTVEPPRDSSHGDLATNAAMVLAKPAGMNPRALADLLVAELGALGEVTEASVAGPGFINLRLVDDSWRDELALIFSEGGDYGRSTMGQGRRVNVEYVSANPTGPMHVGHCRGAVVGDALAGNDAVEQARQFHATVGIDAVILTKLDVDAKGGAALSIASAIGRPIAFVGIGQDYDDLMPFDAVWIVERIFAA